MILIFNDVSEKSVSSLVSIQNILGLVIYNSDVLFIVI